jgi:hypothetical protein
MSNEIAAILEPRDEEQVALDLAEEQAARTALEKKEKAQATARTNALAKLSELGLTKAEIEAIL